jgi:hypothetical protein
LEETPWVAAVSLKPCEHRDGGTSRSVLLLSATILFVLCVTSATTYSVDAINPGVEASQRNVVVSISGATNVKMNTEHYSVVDLA